MRNQNANMLSSNLTYKLTIRRVLGLMTFFTVLSQLPQLVNAGYSSIISRTIWVLGFIIAILNGGFITVKRVTGALVMACTLVAFSIVQVLTIKMTLFSTLSGCILLSIFILFVSTLFGKQLNKNDLEYVAKCYVLASAILALDLLFTTLRNADLSNRAYIYASKNSAGVILFTGFVLTMVYGFKKRKSLNNVFCIFLMSIFFLTILLLKTRAMIVCFPLILIIFTYFSPFGKKAKSIIIFISIVAAILLLNKQVYDIVINQIIFNNRNHTLKDVSSERFSDWAMLGKNMNGNWVIGDGRTEQESLILTALLQYGVFMGGYIILYALWPLVYSLQKIKKTKNKHIFCLLCIAAVYFVDAIFEQLAPFGPGVRCFFLWMLLGVMLSNNKLLEEEVNES